MEKQKENKPSFNTLFEKFQFHNNSVQFHAHLAKFIAEQIKEDHYEEAKKTGYFNEKFFEEDQKAKAEEGN